MRRIRTMVVAGLMAVSTLAVGAVTPVAAADVDGAAAYWKIGQNGIKGLVAVVENPSISRVAFHLTGLKASHAYKVQGYASPCGQPGARLFSRSGSSSANGVWWDPTPIPQGANAIVSIRVRAANGKVVACSTAPAGALNAQTVVIKLKKAGGLRGLVVVDSESDTRVVASVSGLVPNATYQMIGAGGLCTQIAILTFSLFRDANGKGVVRVDEIVAPATAGLNDTVSVGIHKQGSQTGACGNALNLV